MIRITKNAISQLKKVANPDILFYCKSGGCNGLEYILEPTNNPDKADKQKIDSNTNIWLCHRSTLYLLGTELSVVISIHPWDATVLRDLFRRNASKISGFFLSY